MFKKFAPSEMLEGHLNMFVPTPKDIVDGLNSRYGMAQTTPEVIFETSSQIPDITMRALVSDLKLPLERPRVIFHSKTYFRKDADY